MARSIGRIRAKQIADVEAYLETHPYIDSRAAEEELGITQLSKVIKIMREHGGNIWSRWKVITLPSGCERKIYIYFKSYRDPDYKIPEHMFTYQ